MTPPPLQAAQGWGARDRGRAGALWAAAKGQPAVLFSRVASFTISLSGDKNLEEKHRRVACPFPGPVTFHPPGPVELFGDLMKKTLMIKTPGAAEMVSPLAGYLLCRGAVVSHVNISAWQRGRAS